MQNDSGTTSPISELPLDTNPGSGSSDSYTPPPQPAVPVSSLEPVGDMILTPPPSETAADPSSSTSSDGSPSSTPSPPPRKPSAKKTAKLRLVAPPEAREYTPPPDTDPVHGTDCEPWYLWAAEHADDIQFHALYNDRRQAINRRNLGSQFAKFLERLNTEDRSIETQANLLEVAYGLIQNIEGQQSEEWNASAASFFESYNGKVPEGLTTADPVENSEVPEEEPGL